MTAIQVVTTGTTQQANLTSFAGNWDVCAGNQMTPNEQSEALRGKVGAAIQDQLCCVLERSRIVRTGFVRGGHAIRENVRHTKTGTQDTRIRKNVRHTKTDTRDTRTWENVCHTKTGTLDTRIRENVRYTKTATRDTRIRENVR